MSNKALNKKIYIICGSFLVILLVFFTGLAIQKLNYEKDLLSDGIRTQAQVINMYHLKTSTGKIKRSYIEIAVFEDTIATAKFQKKELKKKPSGINDKIDALFEDIGTKKTPSEDYKKITLLTDLKNYGATKIGQWKTFVYLKNEVNEGMLLDNLD